MVWRTHPLPAALAAAALAGAALVTACSPAPADNQAEPTANAAAAAPTGSPAPASAVTVVVRGDGLLVETPGHATPLSFGTSTPQQAQAALAALGDPRRSSNQECPAGPLDFMEWDNGIQLAFQDGKLAGWWASDKASGIATAAGLRPGSPRAALGKASVEDSSVGKVFTIAEVNGLLDEATGATVSALWAGAACIFS